MVDIKLSRRNLLLGSASVLALLMPQTAQAAIGRGIAPSLIIPGGASVTLGTVTMQNLSGATRTGDIPVDFLYPMGTTDFPAGNKIVLYDGATALDTQESNISTDRASKRRVVTGTAIWRSGNLTSGSAKAFTVKVESGSPLTGTAITDDNILATDYDVTITITNAAGTVYTASARDALNASGTWSGTNNGGDPWRNGTYRSGPFVTEIIGSVSLKTGSTPHAFLRAQFTISAYKAASGAVSGGNPILYIDTYVSIENGYLFVSSPSDLLYGATITVGETSPADIFGNANNPGNIDLTTQAPAATLTIANGTTPPGYSGGTAKEATRSTGTWTADDIGRIIEADTGKLMRIWSYTNSTTVTLYNYRGTGNDGLYAQGTFSTAITNGTYTSGNWKQHGICHLAGGKWYRRVWWDLNADHIARPDWAQARASKVMLNWSAPAGNYQAADMTALNAQGVAATRYKRPFRGIGDYYHDVDGGGQSDTEYLNVMPAWFHRISNTYSYNDYRKCQENAEAYMSLEYAYRYEGSGNLLDIINTSVPLDDVAWHSTTSSHHPNVPSTRYSYWNFSIPNASHVSGPFCPMWWLTGGSYFWLEQQQFFTQYLWSWVGISPGDGTLRGPSTSTDQERSAAWFYRHLFHSTIMTPDGFALTPFTKTLLNTWTDDQMDWAVTNMVNDTTNFGINGPKQQHAGGATDIWSAWQSGYSGAVLSNAKENGLLTGDGSTYYDWYMAQFIACSSTSGANALNNPTFMAGEYFTFFEGPTDGVQANADRALTFETMYEQLAKTPASYHPNMNGNNWNIHGKTITSLDKTDAAAVTLNFSSAYFLPAAPDNAWYLGGWVITTDGGAGIITAVNSAGTQVTVDTTVTSPTYVKSGSLYSGTSYGTSTNIDLPTPHPSVYPTTTLNSPNDGSPSDASYFVKFAMGIAPLVDQGVAGASAGWTTFKYHWETDGALGSTILPSDNSAWGEYPAQWCVTPR